MFFDTRNSIALASVVVITLLVTAFFSFPYLTKDESGRLDTFRENQEKWQQTKPSAYRYVLTSGCMFVVSYKIEHTKEGLFSYPIENGPEQAPVSIADIFAEAEKAALNAHSVSIQYHPYLGFPQKIQVDWEENVIDDECFIQITDFEVLEQ